MRVYRGLNDPRLTRHRRSVTIGVFDGVHLAHRAILKAMLAFSGRLKTSSMVITFHPHPSKVLKSSSASTRLLVSLAHRIKLFETMGVKEVLVIPFNKRLASMPREKFLEEILIKRLGMRAMVIGHDFCFGRGALGRADYLKESSKRFGFLFKQVEALKLRGGVVSSSAIRELIERGNLREASRMLGRPVSVYGTVIRGRGRGRRLGFPTANLNPHHEALPPAGVYGAYGYLGKKKVRAVVHIGPRPTFGESERTLEAHFLGVSETLYGRDIELFFLKRLRTTQHFKDAPSLTRAIRRDISKVKSIRI